MLKTATDRQMLITLHLAELVCRRTLIHIHKQVKTCITCAFYTCMFDTCIVLTSTSNTAPVIDKFHGVPDACTSVTAKLIKLKSSLFNEGASRADCDPYRTLPKLYIAKTKLHANYHMEVMPCLKGDYCAIVSASKEWRH